MPDSSPQKKLKRSATPELFLDSDSGELVEVPELVPLEPGNLIAGKYKIISTLGKSELAVVYKVEHTAKQREFALKLFQPEFSDSQIERFQTDAKAVSRLDHPNIAQLVDFGTIDNKQPYCVSEFTEGCTLAEYLQRCGRLTYDDIFGVFLSLAWALQHAHEQGVIHRNVKPSNILLVGEQGNWSCKLLDLATGKLSEGNRKSTASHVRSNVCPEYLSPEQFTPHKTDQRSDIYSMGCVLFEAITARPPFPCSTLEEAKSLHLEGSVPSLREASLGREFPEALENILMTMLDKDPQKRFSSASQVAENLMRLKMSSQLQIKQKKKEKSYNRKLVFGVGLFAAFCAGLIAFNLSQIYHDTRYKVPIEFMNDRQDILEINPREQEDELPLEKLDTSTAPFLVEKRTVGKQEYREYKFTKISIGILTDPESNSIEAKGPLGIPWYGPWKFKTNPRIFETCPNAFRRFGNDELQAITFHYCSDQFKNVLDFLDRFENLHELRFEYVHLNAQDFSKIEKLKKIRSLSLMSTTLSPEILCVSPILKQLEVLEVGEIAEIGKIIDAIKQSEKLVSLTIRNCELSPQDIQNLGKLKRLEELELSGGTVNAALKKEIRKLLPTTRIEIF